MKDKIGELLYQVGLVKDKEIIQEMRFNETNLRVNDVFPITLILKREQPQEVRTERLDA